MQIIAYIVINKCIDMSTLYVDENNQYIDGILHAKFFEIKNEAVKSCVTEYGDSVAEVTITVREV